MLPYQKKGELNYLDSNEHMVLIYSCCKKVKDLFGESSCPQGQLAPALANSFFIPRNQN